MSSKHFCNRCNVYFHRAIDFIRHKHEDLKPLIDLLTDPVEKQDD